VIVNLSKEEVRACADIALNRWMMKWGSIDRENKLLPMSAPLLLSTL